MLSLPDRLYIFHAINTVMVTVNTSSVMEQFNKHSCTFPAAWTCCTALTAPWSQRLYHYLILISSINNTNCIILDSTWALGSFKFSERSKMDEKHINRCKFPIHLKFAHKWKPNLISVQMICLISLLRADMFICAIRHIKAELRKDCSLLCN